MIFVIIGVIAVGTCLYACCKVAGDADEREERFLERTSQEIRK